MMCTYTVYCFSQLSIHRRIMMNDVYIHSLDIEAIVNTHTDYHTQSRHIGIMMNDVYIESVHRMRFHTMELWT